MKPASKKSIRKPRSDGGAQALNIGPDGVTEKDSPTINAVKKKETPPKY
jgi:hypothetical protein